MMEATLSEFRLAIATPLLGVAPSDVLGISKNLAQAIQRVVSLPNFFKDFFIIIVL